jgi:hypothetical protein
VITSTTAGFPLSTISMARSMIRVDGRGEVHMAEKRGEVQYSFAGLN